MKSKDIIAVNRVQMKYVPGSSKCRRNHCVKRVNFKFFSSVKRNLFKDKKYLIRTAQLSSNIGASSNSIILFFCISYFMAQRISSCMNTSYTRQRTPHQQSKNDTVFHLFI